MATSSAQSRPLTWNLRPRFGLGPTGATSPQAAFAPYHCQIRPILDIPDEEIVVCGMALGHEDESKPENQLRSERAPLEEFVTFVK